MHLDGQEGLPSARYVPAGKPPPGDGRNSLSSPDLKQKHLKEGRRKSRAQGQQDGHQTFSGVDPRQHHIQLLITDGCFQLHEVTPH